MTLALTVGVLVAGAVYLMMQRGLVRVVLGFVLVAHAANLTLMAAGGTDRRGEPLGQQPDPATTADALPQAFVLTAIVIAFAITIYLLVLAAAGREDDDTDGPTGGDMGGTDVGPHLGEVSTVGAGTSRGAADAEDPHEGEDPDEEMRHRDDVTGVPS
ncbi:sodium:proton antiporter [Pseudokineococcus sp. 1T1Z-3]|uniref:sodium:proton antiporter n=1 Tax=Pseudokineococcus sp. 1T1Z-3 TaxID=3132745 RepID=UPI00309DD39B